jgi:nitroreductase/CTP:molybdopterin cytidylyltransferase MocA
MGAVAIVPAAGSGGQPGADPALFDLGGITAIERVVSTCRAAGVDDVLVVRGQGAAPLPPLAARALVAAAGSAAADLLRTANGQLPDGTDRVAVFPIGQALVEAETLAAVLARAGSGIALPQWRGRPGHPIALRREVFAEIAAPGCELSDLVRRDAARVTAVPSANSWVLADLDRPEDLRAARCALAGEPFGAVAQMFRHRSRRTFRREPLAAGQLERLVDAARHASTSNFIQAYSVVAVSDPARRAECARLCGDQPHVAEAAVFAAICADLSKLAAACERHGTALQAGSFELFLQATIDAALLGQNLQLAAEAEGLGSCMIGGARNHPVALAALLGLPPGVFVVFGLTLGIPADDPLPRLRMPLGGVLHRERYDPAAAVAALEVADEIVRQWARDSNARARAAGGAAPIDEHKGWTERMARDWGLQSRYAVVRRTLVAELRQLGFGLDEA